MNEKYHPVLEAVFETKGENKGHVKDTELVHGLASAANDVYDKKVEEKRYDADEFHAEIDAHMRRGLAKAAVASEYPYPEASSMDHYVAADLASKGKRSAGSEGKLLGELTTKAKEVVDQYDDLQNKAA